MRRYLISIVVICLLFVSCKQNEVAPPAMEPQINSLVIKGNHAQYVSDCTQKWTIIRDAVPDEITDTVYNIKTYVRLKLNKSFESSKMDTIPQLKFVSKQGNTIATLELADSSAIDNILIFMKSAPGVETQLSFVGKVNKSRYLILNEAQKAVLSHFSLFDPEANADPKIDSTLDDYEDCYKNMQSMIEEGIPPASTMMVRMFDQVSELETILNVKKKRMTPSQLERYNSISKKIQEL